MTRASSNPTPSVRHLHLGLGNFFRAHQAWYTMHAIDGDQWPIAAFTGRQVQLARILAAQGGRYTLTIRGPESDSVETITSVPYPYAAVDQDAFRACFRSPELAVVTLTVTEAGYRHAGAGLDNDDAEVRSDIDTLRRNSCGVEDADLRTMPARLLAGLACRRAADGGPLALVPCDNLPGNGAVLRASLVELADEVDPSLREWLARHVTFVDTVVDRITPALGASDRASLPGAADFVDRAPVITEPFSEWILAGAFPAGRPAWESFGARFADDCRPYEQRKLWLLNGAHTLLAYLGSLTGHHTVADAVTDPVCVDWMRRWWRAAIAYLDFSAADLDRYCDALMSRFENRRIKHELAQIAADGSQKLPVRILPVALLDRQAGRAASAAALVVAAWLCHLRGAGAPVRDPRTDLVDRARQGSPDSALRHLLVALDYPQLGDDEEFVRDCVTRFEELGRGNGLGSTS